MPQNDFFPLEIGHYPVERDLLAGTVESETDSGRQAVRLKRAPRRLHRLSFHRRSTADKLLLETFYHRFQDSWFSLRDPVFAALEDGTLVERYFSVHFATKPSYRLEGFEQWEIACTLVDRVGAALFQYPDPSAGHISHFIEEDKATVVAGVWTAAANAGAHDGNEKTNPNTNTTDKITFAYGGYGFRLWLRKASNLGIVTVLLDGASLGTVDLYSAAALAAQPVFTKLDVALGLHVVALVATNTKNAASSANTIPADALEVMI